MLKNNTTSLNLQDFDCLIGQTIFNKFIIEKLIASGNQGSVYEISKIGSESKRKLVMKLSINPIVIQTEIKILK